MLNNTCILVDEKHADFWEIGLKTFSVISLNKVATISADLVVSEIGEVGAS